MSTQQKNSNGIAKDAATKTTALVVVKDEETKPQLKPDLPPLEDRLHRLNQLFNLQQKYNKLEESLQKLNDFEIKKDGERSRITIADDSRNDFTTYNAEIVAEVVEFIKTRISEKKKALEPQLKW